LYQKKDKYSVPTFGEFYFGYSVIFRIPPPPDLPSTFPVSAGMPASYEHAGCGMHTAAETGTENGINPRFSEISPNMRRFNEYRTTPLFVV